MNVLTNAIGMIPVAGPFLAILFPVAWTLIVDPDSAYDLLKDLVPGIDLMHRMIRQISDFMNETKEYLPTGWGALALPTQPSSGGAHNVSPEKENAPESASKAEETKLEDIGQSLAFIMAAETLAKSGNVPSKEKSVDDEDALGEIELVNPPTEFPDEKGGDPSFD